MSLRDVLERFESLGNNCEFGIVQAAVGHTAPSLLRNCGFDSTSQIISLLDNGLDGMFEEGSFSFARAEPWPDYALNCHRYGIRFHTGLPSKEEQPPAEFEKRITAFRYMKAKLLDDLRSGHKVFVYRHKREFDHTLAHRLLASIRRHGPGSLLFVREDRRPERRFAWVEASDKPGLFYAGIPQLSNENPPIINFAAWEKIVFGALELAQAADKPQTPQSILPSSTDCLQPTPPPGAGAVIEHRSFDHRPFFSFSVGAAPLERYTAKAWIWIPSDFVGAGIGLVMLGFPTEQHTACNLDQRKCWQLMSVTARVPAGRGQIVPAINVAPGARGVLYTTGWTIRLAEDETPSKHTSGVSSVAAISTSENVLSYSFNNGGLSNQKLALLGLFVKAQATGADIVLPDLHMFDQGDDIGRKRGMSIPFRHVPLGTYYDLSLLREFADRRGIRIRNCQPQSNSHGWEFFGEAGTVIARAHASGEFLVDGFGCDFFRHLVSRVRSSQELTIVRDELANNGIRLTVQCRIEADWQLHTNTSLNVVAAGEDHNPGILKIMEKVKRTLAPEIMSGGVYVASDEAWMPDTKEKLRDTIARELDIRLFWKSDFLSPEAMALPPLLLSMLDFEIAVQSESFVGLSRSTFSNLAGVERFARTRQPVLSHYIYNAPGPLLARRTDNGAYHWAEGAARTRAA